VVEAVVRLAVLAALAVVVMVVQARLPELLEQQILAVVAAELGMRLVRLAALALSSFLTSCLEAQLLNSYLQQLGKHPLALLLLTTL